MKNKTFIAAIILLAFISPASSLTMVKPAWAQPSIENVSTAAYIAVQPENIAEGQSINVSIQILPAPPSANDVFENLTVVLVSPAQGVSGYGPWSKGPSSSDANGKALFTFDIPTFGGGWIVEFFFPGQYFANNTIYYQRGDWQKNFYISTAQTPTPSSSSTKSIPPISSPSLTPSLSLSPNKSHSSSPAQQPILEPSPSASPPLIIDHFPNYPLMIQLGIVAIVIVAIAGTLVYFKGRGRKRE